MRHDLEATTVKQQSVLDGSWHELPATHSWIHDLADSGRRCPCRPEIRDRVVFHRRTPELDKEAAGILARAVGMLGRRPV